MPDALASLIEGMPVEIGRVDRELKRLWQEGEGAATRASLMNFAVYCEGVEAMKQTTELISQLTRDHACRAILIAVDPQKAGAGVQAWISAHCHLGRAGAKQVCCEQITFLLERDGRPLVPNIVFSHLDSDLPLALWWRGDFPQHCGELWTWVDRLIFDSQTWREPRRQLDELRSSIAPASPRMALCDLNWTRSLSLRQAAAQVFDLPDNRAELPRLETVEVTHAPGMRSAALLLAGWLAAQLRWTLAGTPNGAVEFRTAANGKVTVTFQEKPGAALGGLRLSSAASSFSVAHREDSPFLYEEVHLPAPPISTPPPCGKDDLVSLLNDELMTGGQHKVYLKAVAAIADAL